MRRMRFVRVRLILGFCRFCSNITTPTGRRADGLVLRTRGNEAACLPIDGWFAGGRESPAVRSSIAPIRSEQYVVANHEWHGCPVMDTRLRNRTLLAPLEILQGRFCLYFSTA